MRCVLPFPGVILLVLTSLVLWPIYTDDELSEALSVEPATLDFGTIWAQKGFKWKVRLHNRGDDDITISRVTASCQCTTLAPQALVVPKHGAATLELSLDLTLRDLCSSPDLSPIAIDIFPEIAARAQPQPRWTVKGSIRRPFCLATPAFYFGESANRLLPTHSFETQSCSFQAAIPIRSIESRIVPSALGTSTVRLDTPQSGRIEVTPTMDIESGPFSFAVVLDAETLEGERLPSVELPVRGVSVRDIHAVPPVIIFGPFTLGEMADSTVLLQSRTGRRFSVLNIATTSDSLGWSQAEIKGVDQAFAFNVTQRIATVGPHNEELRVRISIDGSLGDEVVRIPVTYVGQTNGEVRQ